MVDAGSNDQDLSYGQLIGKGILLGMLHVLSGPDHLAALVALSANVGKCWAFSVGVGWGIGHSTGLLVVATILLLSLTDTATGTLDLSDRARRVIESLVGVFLILLGIYGFFISIRRRRLQNNTMTNPIKSATEVANAVYNNPKDAHSDNSIAEKDTLPGITNCTSTEALKVPTETSSVPISGSATAKEETKQRGEMELCQQMLEDGELPSTDTQNLTSTTLAEQMSVHGTSTTRKERNCRINIIRREQIMSFLVGILHGVAGPGGVLGILPAAQLQNLSLAYAYLASFCISSIIIMGIFASLFGTLTHKLSQITQLEFQIECFSAGVCTLIGTIWLSLSIAGKLGDVF